jgi:hypothetical protein
MNFKSLAWVDLLSNSAASVTTDLFTMFGVDAGYAQWVGLAPPH